MYDEKSTSQYSRNEFDIKGANGEGGILSILENVVQRGVASQMKLERGQRAKQLYRVG